MTSIVDKYYRKISENIDNLKMKFDISALLVKSKEHDSLIDTNKNNISDNYNFTQINKKKSEFNTSLIDTNRDNIASNSNLINTNKNGITNNVSSIDTNKNSITNINNDLTNLKNGYKLKDILVFNISNNVSKAMSKSNPSFVIFTGTINNNIKKDSYIEFNLSIYMLFLLHYINAQFFYVLLKVFNKNNQLITSIRLPLIGMISKQGIVSNTCYLIMPNDYENIKIEMSIELKENQNRNDIIKILDFDNYIYCKIFEKLDTSIEFDV